MQLKLTHHEQEQTKHTLKPHEKRRLEEITRKVNMNLDRMVAHATTRERKARRW